MRPKHRNFLEHMDYLDRNGEAYQVAEIALTSGSLIGRDWNLDVVSRSDTHLCLSDPKPEVAGEYMWVRLVDIQSITVVEL